MTSSYFSEQLLLSAPGENFPLNKIITDLLRIPKTPMSEFVISLVNKLLEHDEGTYQHSVEVGVMSYAMGSLLGLNPLLCLYLGLLHDIGKLAVPSLTLRLRFKAHFNNLLVGSNDIAREDYHHYPSDAEKEILHKHGQYGEIILTKLGFSPLFQKVARDHGRSSFHFESEEPIELQLVVLADWFSAIKDAGRNKYRGTNQQKLLDAVARMDRQFAENTTNLSTEVIEAFRTMVSLGIYPFNHHDGHQPDFIHQIYRNCVAPTPQAQEVCLATRVWSKRNWEPSLPDLKGVMRLWKPA